MSLAESYTREIRRELHRFATWEPGQPMTLGDFGELRGAQFVRLGNLADIGLEFAVRADGHTDHVRYTSEGSVEMGFGGSAGGVVGPVAEAKAKLEVSFKAEHAILFTAADVTYETVADHLELERAILERFELGGWDARHSIVTELARSGSTTVIVSAARDARIVLEAEGEVDKIDLANAGLNARLAAQSNIGFQAVTESGMTPLLGLSRVRPRGLFWWRRTALRRQLGFTPDPDAAQEPDPTFQDSLDERLDTLRHEALQAGEVQQAFEWADLQPPGRP